MGLPREGQAAGTGSPDTDTWTRHEIVRQLTPQYTHSTRPPTDGLTEGARGHYTETQP